MIEIREVSKSYLGKPIIENLSLTIPDNTVFGFLGQNGAGKTTTMKMMVGLASPDSGSISIDGRSVDQSETRRNLGFMPEAPYFYDRLTGLEFLIFCGELFGLPASEQERYEDILRSINLHHARDAKIATYSKGMKQRLGFAQALVNDPQYIFLDEPLDGLDPLGRKEIKEIIKSLKAAGKTVFFNSHILYDTEELCDQIGIIDKGQLLYIGPVQEFCKGQSLEVSFVKLIEATRQEKTEEKISEPANL
ncbi:MAG: hypothetical protein COU11_01720 [Candidatus Harrisonbacteria bacterium CG10_big_fil_rev_8_21_14_0_10_49_15]|uniref:ABC transporter domain-containing protein n=1 Tax=Candidatus Harrisonbacteria bacterium CG10_big_fil_rev_8_21_14_0_10_49_15 TaxID=1974587 RepID=A0A2H0UL91_9BACT|nr:MAG: hypothetical protein COU11_01720 [Candidatus Harrisonbacteria bacterium CG10_big_fil_rev_8_21_14_0_10_49_15]